MNIRIWGVRSVSHALVSSMSADDRCLKSCKAYILWVRILCMFVTLCSTHMHTHTLDIYV